MLNLDQHLFVEMKRFSAFRTGRKSAGMTTEKSKFGILKMVSRYNKMVIRKLFLIIVMLLLDHGMGSAQQSNLCINEFMAINVLTYENRNGGYEDWIEIYNSSTSPIDLAGYHLADNLAGGNPWQIPFGQQTKTTIPANGFLVLIVDVHPELGADHLDFKLGSTSGQIVLLNSNLTSILDSVSYGLQFRDVSYGRSPDGGRQWMYMSNSTPGVSNQSGYIGFVLPPTIDQSSGYYQNITISIQAATIGDTIRYTLDGSDPIETSSLYLQPINITQTSILKVRAFRTGVLPSQIITKTFYTTSHDLPVLAIITDPKNLFDPSTGIYTHDYDGRAWERFGEIEFFDNQSLAFHIPVGLRIQGNTGPKDFDKKSFRAYLRSGYGQERLNYQICPTNPVTSFSRLVFRSGYDDSMEPANDGSNATATLLRDPIVTTLWKKIGGLGSSGRFAVCYLNNNYYGIYEVKESVDENFIYDHLGFLDVDLIRTRWDSLETVYGDKTHWNELVSFFQNNSFTADAKIDEASRFLDLDNFINLQALVHATQYRSWAYGASIFREKVTSAPWQWTIWDADRTFIDVNWNGFNNQYHPTVIFLENLITKKLFQNHNFSLRYINRLADLLNTTFAPDNVKSIIDSLAQCIRSEIPNDVAKWNNTVATWNTNVEYLKTFVEQRPSIVRQQIQNYFSLNGIVTASVEITGRGKVRINTIEVEGQSWSGKYFENIPLTVTAIPEPGYQFSRWGNGLANSKTITLNLSNDTTISAVFIPMVNANADLIAPKRIKPGKSFPFVVRVLDAYGDINPVEQTPMNIIFNGGHQDTSIAIKRGAGTGWIQFNGNSPFLMQAHNAQVAEANKQIEFSTTPTITYSGTLPTGDVIWDSTADRLITSDITVPAGCRLIVKHGTWIVLRKYINIFVRGEISVSGTADDPVVITSENRSEPWGGMEFDNARASFEYCIVFNGAGDISRPFPTNDGWHTTHQQHIFFGKNNSVFNFNQCFFLYSIGKVFGVQDGIVTVTNSVSSFVWHGGEFHRVLLNYRNSHILNVPDDNNATYTEDIDTDGFHIDYVNPKYPQFSVLDRLYIITGKDDAIDHHRSRLRVTNCWLEDFVHEGVAASGGDTIIVFNTVALNNDQGFEAGNTDSGVGPFVFVDHCVAVGNNVGIRVGDSYWGKNYRDFMKVTNTIAYNNQNNIWNYLFGTQAPLSGALDISYSMTNDTDDNVSPHCISGIPQFDDRYYLLPGSPGVNMGMNGTNMGRVDSIDLSESSIVINEIMYNAPAGMNSKDWIELYNPNPVEKDISDWIIKDEENGHSYSIPKGASIPPFGFAVICGDTTAFKSIYSSIEKYFGNFSFGLGGIDQVRLYTPNGFCVDIVAYMNLAPWPVEADGHGCTLVLRDPEKNNALRENWNRSGQYGGSPGRPNHANEVDEELTGSIPNVYLLEQNYPNPFNPITCIKFCIPNNNLVNLKIFDILGREIAILVDGRKEAGFHSVYWNAGGFSSGVYFYRLQSGSFVETKKLMVIK